MLLNMLYVFFKVVSNDKTVCAAGVFLVVVYLVFPYVVISNYSCCP